MLTEDIPSLSSPGDESSDRDVFDRLFEAAPDKLNTVKSVSRTLPVLGHSPLHTSCAGTFTTSYFLCWDIHHFILPVLGHSPLHTSCAGTFTSSYFLHFRGLQQRGPTVHLISYMHTYYTYGSCVCTHICTVWYPVCVFLFLVWFSVTSCVCQQAFE